MSLNENKLAKRGSLLDAAAELFEKKGINTTTVDEVVKRAGVAKGTFYLYFRDKYDLLDQIILRKSAAIVSRAFELLREESRRREMDFVSQLLFFADTIIDYMKENRAVLPLIGKNLSVCFSLLLDGEDSEQEEVVSMFCTRGYSREAAKKHIYVLTSMLGSLCCEAIISEKPYDIEELRPEIHLVLKKLCEE